MAGWCFPTSLSRRRTTVSSREIQDNKTQTCSFSPSTTPTPASVLFRHEGFVELCLRKVSPVVLLTRGPRQAQAVSHKLRRRSRPGGPERI